MDFIERWLHISPDGGSGVSEFLVVTTVVTMLLGIGLVLFRGHFPRKFIKYLERFGKRENRDRFHD